MTRLNSALKLFSAPYASFLPPALAAPLIPFHRVMSHFLFCCVLLFCWFSSSLGQTSTPFPNSDVLPPGMPTTFRLPVTYRDFEGCQKKTSLPEWTGLGKFPLPRCSQWDDLQPGPADCTIGRAPGQPPRNPHFDGWDTETARPNRCGIPRLVFKRVLPQLGADGTPVWNDAFMDCMWPGGTKAGQHFYEWYHDTPGQNMKISDFVTLNWGGDPMFPPSGRNCYVWDAYTKPYFPIDHRGLGNYCWYGPTPPLGDPGIAAVQAMQYGPNRRPECLFQIDAEYKPLLANGSCNSNYYMHNFHFTDHIQYYFTYNGAAGRQPFIRFQGDDDCWIFMNGEMILDIGGVDWCMDVQMQMNGNVLSTAYYTDPDCRLAPDSRPPLNTQRALPAFVSGQNYRIDIFHAQRKVECSHLQMCLGNMFPACPTAGAECAPPTPDGCGAFVCDNQYQCSPVARNNDQACPAVANAPPAPQCQRYECLNGTCQISPDQTVVGTKCIPPPGVTVHSCLKWVCGQNGTCIEVPNEELMNQTCIPAAGQSTTPPDCMEYVCDGTGQCLAVPDPALLGQICTGPASLQCQKYVCGPAGECASVTDPLFDGKVCVPDKGLTVPPCMTYGCLPDGSCGIIPDPDTLLQPCILDGFVATPCLPTPICLANGTCAVVPSAGVVGLPCTPPAGGAVNPCQTWQCAADGTCISLPDQDKIGTQAECVPAGVDLSQLPKCYHYICQTDGTCAVAPDPAQVGTTCDPPSGTVISGCMRYICTDTGACERTTDADIGEVCTAPAETPQVECQSFICVSDAGGALSCESRPTNLTFGQPCTPDATPNQCLDYMCTLEGSCEATARTGAPCTKPANLNDPNLRDECLEWACTPAGTCEGSVTTATRNNTCIPRAGEVANPCYHYICGADGTCTERELRTDMENPLLPGARRIPCIPDIPNYNSTTDPCANWYCLGNGTCGKFETALSNSTACLSIIPQKKARGKVGVIVGVVVGAAAVAAIVVAAVIAYRALASPAAGPASAGGDPGAAADAFANPLFNEKVVRQNQLAE